MTSTATGHLHFIISLTNHLTSPIAGIQNQINQLTDGASRAFGMIGMGVAGLIGAGYAIKAALEPAIDMDRAMGEVRSLGVVEADLLQLKNTAMDFAVEYGKSAADFVRASYDIQSAISGLTGQELGDFTKASGILAAATKADTATITSYMGTMYGIFKQQAAVMGNADWVERVAGQTASAVQMFKTTGSEMSSAFSSLGAGATAVGVSMNEQMAILGTLQSSLSGSEAGTQYNAFLAGLSKAESALGLQFTDAAGMALPVVEVLDKIKAKYGELSLVDQADLTKAFGTDLATKFIVSLSNDVDGLRSSINKLGDIKGMDTALAMARAQVDAWERLGAAVDVVRIGFGSALLPVINPLVDTLADMGFTLQRWTQLFPNLTRWVGYFFLGLMGLIAVMSLLTLTAGLAFGSFVVLTNPITWVLAALAGLAYIIYQLLFNWDGFKDTLRSVADALSFLPLPVGLIVEAFIWLVDHLYLVGDAWDWLKASWQNVVSYLSDTSVFQMLMQVFSFFNPVLGLVAQGFHWLSTLWQQFTHYLAEVGPFEAILKIFSLFNPLLGLVIKAIQGLGDWWEHLKKTFADVGVFEFLASIVDWVIDKINRIPGINIEIDKEALKPNIASLKRPIQSQVPTGGLLKTINNNQQHNQNNYQTNHIYTQTVDSQFLHNQIEMEAP
ncbi:phage tail tape measure protein [Spartinivicinus ruber]|uniref:phage tail tape measure protein n=1 Tax=Spartinivicinus ruber TaxID=2683272 RepID=UPI0013D0E541|nr:phage tail tape measure protein [Spartinivicinus ruber]